MAPRFNKIMSKMQDEEDVPADIPNPEMYMPEPEREIARPFPPGVAAQEAFDDMLQRRVMDPLYNAGHEDLGAALSAIPSAAHSMIVPQTDLDVAGTIIPLPGVAKLMKQGKFRRIRNAMKAEAPEEVAGIIAKQAGKMTEPGEKIYASADDLQRIKDEGDPFKQMKPKAEVRDIDEKEVLRRSERLKSQEKQFFDQHGASEREIEKLIKEKYGIDGDNWSSVDSEADSNFGTSDLSGKRGNVIEITDGDTTLEVLEDEFMDIMGLSGAIPMEDTPFAQAFRQNNKQNAPSDTIDQMADFFRREPKVEAPKSRRDEKIDEAFRKQSEPTPPSPLKVVDPPKTPKGDPEASSRFPGIQSQLDVVPTRMDEAGRSFGDVGQSEFMPDSRPMPRFEEIEKRNYVEKDMDPVDGIIDKWRNSLDPNELEQLTPGAIEKARRAVKASIDRGKEFSVADFIHDETGGWSSTKGQLYERSLRRTMNPETKNPGEYYNALSKDLKPVKDKNNNYIDKPILDKLGKVVSESGVVDIQRTPRIRALQSQESKAFFPSADAKNLQKEMYKGRPSHEAEQAKLFPKVNEAVSVKKLFQKPDGSLVDENGKVVMTKEEAERLMYEKLKDF